MRSSSNLLPKLELLLGEAVQKLRPAQTNSGHALMQMRGAAKFESASNATKLEIAKDTWGLWGQPKERLSEWPE